MKLDDFNFLLPPALIARYPLASRTASRLLCLDAQTNTMRHQQFSDIETLLEPGDLLVFNNTKVIPARLFGKKETGGMVEVLLERLLDERRMLAQVRASKQPKPGDILHFPNRVDLEIIAREGQFYELRYLGNKGSILEVIERIGQIPLPPYMDREPEESDRERYQTVYAEHKGSVAAPTAGLHFDRMLLNTLEKKQVNTAYLTLHIGAGTFTPVRIDDVKAHQMHAEYFEVSEDVCKKVRKTRAAGHRVIAVGTTSLRALESASQSGELQPYQGETNIFIYPGYAFRCVDALITNLHLPRSTLLMLVCAFGGYENVMRAYQRAVEEKYRFFSYGDAMWVNK